MKFMQKKICLAACLGFLAAGCAKRGETKAEIVPKAPAAVEAKAEAPLPAQNELKHYIVKRGDCLWTIAAKPDVLGDPFHWPLLYKENRDEITDPDLIQPRQDLGYHSQYSQDQVDAAVKTAEERPPFVRLSKSPSGGVLN
jgi:hypothetical protein